MIQGVDKQGVFCYNNLMAKHLPINPLVVRALFDYDPDTGILRRRQRHSGNQPGNGGNYYRCCTVFGRKYRVNRVVWVWVTGADIPAGLEIDHNNRQKGDNRWDNLHLVTRSQNQFNRKGCDGNNPYAGSEKFMEDRRQRVYRCLAKKRMLRSVTKSDEGGHTGT